jgi:hypothetical protein
VITFLTSIALADLISCSVGFSIAVAVADALNGQHAAAGAAGEIDGELLYTEGNVDKAVDDTGVFNRCYRCSTGVFKQVAAYARV